MAINRILWRPPWHGTPPLDQPSLGFTWAMSTSTCSCWNCRSVPQRWCFYWAKQLRCNTFWPLKVIARDDAIWMCLKNGVFLQFYGRCSSGKKRISPRDFWGFPLPKTGRSLPWLWRLETWDRLPNIPRTSQFTRENTVCLNHLCSALFTYCKMFFLQIP